MSTMKKKNLKVKRKSGTHVRLKPELEKWLNDHAAKRGFHSVPDLLRSITQEYRQRIESAA